jgi:heme/copper-type cytochrome/quinol oxidase subunit 2
MIIKRILTFVSILALFFSLAGCNNNKPKTASPNKTAPKTTNNKDTSSTTNSTSNTARNQYLVIEPAGKLGPDGKMHDAYINGDITLTEGKPVTLHFLNYDGGTHTYTSADLGLNVKVKGSAKKGQPMETTYTFTPDKTGTFNWYCADKCDGQNNQWAMTHTGYMEGTITVNNDPVQHISTVINPGYKLGSDGKLHDAYTPGNMTVSSESPVELTVYNFDDGTHTFTSTDLGVDIAVTGSPQKGATPSITKGTFTPKKKGTFKWLCKDPCDGQNGQWAMTHNNYMTGNITVK